MLMNQINGSVTEITTVLCSGFFKPLLVITSKLYRVCSSYPLVRFIELNPIPISGGIGFGVRLTCRVLVFWVVIMDETLTASIVHRSNLRQTVEIVLDRVRADFSSHRLLILMTRVCLTVFSMERSKTLTPIKIRIRGIAHELASTKHTAVESIRRTDSVQVLTTVNRSHGFLHVAGREPSSRPETGCGSDGQNYLTETTEQDVLLVHLDGITRHNAYFTHFSVIGG